MLTWLVGCPPPGEIAREGRGRKKDAERRGINAARLSIKSLSVKLQSLKERGERQQNFAASPRVHPFISPSARQFFPGSSRLSSQPCHLSPAPLLLLFFLFHNLLSSSFPRGVIYYETCSGGKNDAFDSTWLHLMFCLVRFALMRMERLNRFVLQVHILFFLFIFPLFCLKGWLIQGPNATRWCEHSASDQGAWTAESEAHTPTRFCTRTHTH